jgi:hypothetical protein
MTDGCVRSLYNSSWKFLQLAAGQLLSGQPVRYGKSRRYDPSITYKITHARSLYSSHPGGPPYWASQPYSLRPHWSAGKRFFFLKLPGEGSRSALKISGGTKIIVRTTWRLVLIGAEPKMGGGRGGGMILIVKNAALQGAPLSMLSL